MVIYSNSAWTDPEKYHMDSTLDIMVNSDYKGCSEYEAHAGWLLLKMLPKTHLCKYTLCAILLQYYETL